MEEKELRHNFATNLVKLRNSRGWSQADLGNAINYSFKNVSKWETEETIPSVSVMKEIADSFNVTIDELISDGNVVRSSHKKQNRFIITALASVFPYALGLILFFVLLTLQLPSAYYSFIGAAIVSAIVFITLSAIWYKKWVLASGIVYLIWSISLLVMFILDFYYFWIILIIASVLSLLIFGLFKIYFTHHTYKQ